MAVTQVHDARSNGVQTGRGLGGELGAFNDDEGEIDEEEEEEEDEGETANIASSIDVIAMVEEVGRLRRNGR